MEATMDLYKATGEKVTTIAQAKASLARRTRSAKDARRKMEELKGQRNVILS